MSDEVPTGLSCNQALVLSEWLGRTGAGAQQNGLRFDLYVRGGTYPTRLSGPLETAIRNGDITLRYIP